VDIKVGCCGWGFFRPKQYFGDNWKEMHASILQAYSSMFPLVEVNSSFYRMPMVKTAERWLTEARERNNEFEFTVKAFRGITHEERFAGKSVKFFTNMKDICKALGAKLLLFQTPASFGPEKNNIRAMENFFSRIKKGKLLLAWEPMGRWLGESEKIKEVCREFGLIECVDPLRSELAVKNNEVAYFRLHGFGKPMMYNYKFSDAELRRAKKIVKECGAEMVYVLFNNSYMYDDAERFRRMLQ